MQKPELDPLLKESLKDIPKSSGVYIMSDEKKKIIYVGKAKNLKDRVRSYLNVSSWKLRPKLYHLMPKVKKIDVKVTNSEKEALILEASLVNEYQPKYNVVLKDDKKFPWLMITYDENYPRVVPVRDVYRYKKRFPKTRNKFFGPYSDPGAMWETYKILKEGFKLRIRRKPLFKDRTCMNYHIGLCSGPCQKLISDSDYMSIVKQVEDFLSGRYKAIVNDLKKQMKNYSDSLDYEKAAKARDTIQKIEKVLEKQLVVSDDVSLSQDVFSSYWSEKLMVLELLVIREGKVVSVESMRVDIPRQENVNDDLYLDAFQEAIKLYYQRVDDQNIPHEIILQFKLSDEKNIQTWLSERLNRKIIISYPQKGKKLELLKMAEVNAKLALQKLELDSLNTVEEIDASSVLQSLKLKLTLNNIPSHIECFDISHLSGTNTVASMVAFIAGKPDKNLYRKFNIKSLSIGQIDDFASMKEVVFRRYSNLELDKFPDLIVIDGGKGQLSAAKEAFDEAIKNISLTKIPDLISLAKREEEVFKLNKKDSVLLPKDSSELHLLQKIRDEAHRFAVSFQRQKRTKDAFTSSLEKIEGLSSAKIKKLMNYYGSLKNIQESDLKTFVSVIGLSEGKSKEILGKICLLSKSL